MNKPELLATAGSLEEVSRYLQAGATAVQIGERKFGMRLPGDISRDQLADTVKAAHSHGAKVYVVANNIMANDVLEELSDYLQAVQESGADAVVFGDPAVIVSMRQAGIRLPLHWNPEMTATNYATANYWASKGAQRVILARELNEEEIRQIREYTGMEVQVQVHGMTNIFHSKRQMVTSYRDHLGSVALESEYGKDKQLILIEAERQEEKYPVYEDSNGTHIMSSDDICLLETLHELIEAGIDSFKIEGFMKPSSYNEEVIRIYREAIDTYFRAPEQYQFNEEWLESLERIQPGDRELSFGFLYKEQVY